MANVHIQQHIHQKDVYLWLPLYYYGNVIFELEKAQTSNSTVFMLFITWQSTLKFLFLFDFSECLSFSNFFLIKFWKFLILYLGCGCMTVILWLRWLYITSYPCPWIKNVSAKTTQYVPKCWERSVERKSNLILSES